MEAILTATPAVCCYVSRHVEPTIATSACDAFYGRRANGARSVRVGSFIRRIPSVRMIAKNSNGAYLLFDTHRHMLPRRRPPRKATDLVVVPMVFLTD